jgi:hypothetical protein
MYTSNKHRIIAPVTSSENREYLPVGLIQSNEIVLTQLVAMMHLYGIYL